MFWLLDVSDLILLLLANKEKFLSDKSCFCFSSDASALPLQQPPGQPAPVDLAAAAQARHRHHHPERRDVGQEVEWVPEQERLSIAHLKTDQVDSSETCLFSLTVSTMER